MERHLRLLTVTVVVAAALFASGAITADEADEREAAGSLGTRQTVSFSAGVRITAVPGLMVGDANMDGQTNIVDAMYVAQHTVGLRELDADQFRTGDTTGDSAVNIVDAMHIAQYTVDPTGEGGVLFRPLFDEDHHQGMLDPLTYGD